MSRRAAIITVVGAFAVALAGLGTYLALSPDRTTATTKRALPATFTPPPLPSSPPVHQQWPIAARETTCTQWVMDMDPWQQEQVARELLDYERTHPDWANPADVRPAPPATDQQVAFVTGEITRSCTAIVARRNGKPCCDEYVRMEVMGAYLANYDQLKPPGR